MKYSSFTLLFLIFLSSCSFDNKSGIWKNREDINEKKIDLFENFEKLYTEEKNYDSIIIPNANISINLAPVQKTSEWNDEYYSSANNSANHYYKNSNEMDFKGKKLINSRLNKKFLFDGLNTIIADNKGNLIVYSINQNEIIYKFNFYKKKIKKMDLKLNIIIEDKIIYVSDNVGYLYALDYNKKKILWAKNYKIPFRSNIKISDNKIILADQDNTLHITNKYTGEKLKSFPTEQITLKNNFKNSISLNKSMIFYLNTYGSIYKIDSINEKIEWFINLNPSLDLNFNDLFFSNPVIFYENKLIISTYSHLYILDAYSGSTIQKKKINSLVKPTVSGENLFLLTTDYLLVCINIKSGKVKFSININKEIADFLNTEEKSVSIKSLEILNNNLYLFLENSFIVKLSSKGILQSVSKLKSKINSFPIFINGSILYLNTKNQLVRFN
jgi:outer membrane protein assembly factor BamB